VRKFSFPLHRVLEWRRTQLETEQHRGRELRAELERLETAARRLLEERETERRRILAAAQTEGRDFAALGGYERGCRSALRDLDRRAQDCLGRITAQNQRLVEARRRVRVLELARERRLEHWRAESSREIEALAAEAWLARWEAYVHRRT